MPGPEQKIQTRIIKELRKRGAYVVKVITASRNGVPDLLVCYEGRFIGIEVKTEAGIASAVQTANLAWIIEAGGDALVARSWEDVEIILNKVL